MMKAIFVLLFCFSFTSCSNVGKTSYGIVKPDGSVSQQMNEEQIKQATTQSNAEKTNGRVVILKSVFPKYPKEALEAGIEGNVTLDFIVDEKGKVTEITIVQSAGDLLDKASTDAIKQWRFQPYLKDGVAVKRKFRQQFPFKISE